MTILNIACNSLKELLLLLANSSSMTSPIKYQNNNGIETIRIRL